MKVAEATAVGAVVGVVVGVVDPLVGSGSGTVVSPAVGGWSRLAGPVEGQGGEVLPLLAEHVGGVLDEDPDHHGAEEPGHRGGARPLGEVGPVARDPVLNALLEGGEQVDPDGAGRLLAAHRLAHHEADEVLHLEHGGHDLGQQLGQGQRVGSRALALVGRGGRIGRNPCSISTDSSRSRLLGK